MESRDDELSFVSLPLVSSGASKEMPMNTHNIPDMNIVVLNASKTCSESKKTVSLHSHHSGKKMIKLIIQICFWSP